MRAGFPESHLTAIHGLAILLMAFWLFPLLAYAPWTTSYSHVWIIKNWQEILPPIPIGPRTLARWQQNGQVLRIETGALSATVYWDELSTRRVAGSVVRTSGGTTQGPVTIRWENRQSAVTLHLDAAHPESTFEMLGPRPRRSPHVREHD